MMIYQAKLPDYFYAISLGEHNSDEDAKKALREMLKLDRLPKGTEVWSTTPEQYQRDLEIIAESNKGIGLMT